MITAEQRAERRNHFGASDVPGLMGLSPWANPSDVVASKLYPMEDNGSAAMEIGNRLEPWLLDSAPPEWGPLTRDVEVRVPDLPMVVHLDGYAENPELQVSSIPFPGEAKIVNVSGRAHADEWGDPGTDQVPSNVAIQVHAQMLASHADKAGVIAFIFGRTAAPVSYIVPRDERMIQAIRDTVEFYWEEFVEKKRLPDLEHHAPMSIAVARRIKRVPKPRVPFGPIDAGYVAAWEKAKEALKAAKDAEKEWKEKVAHRLEGAEAADLPDGRVVTYIPQTRREYWVKESTYPVLRVVKGK